MAEQIKQLSAEKSHQQNNPRPPYPKVPQVMTTALHWMIDTINFKMVPFVVPTATFSGYYVPRRSITKFVTKKPRFYCDEGEIEAPILSPSDGKDWFGPQNPALRRRWPYRNKSLSRSGIRLYDDNHCQLCLSNQEPEIVYLGHSLHDEKGWTTCPILRGLLCRICGAKGDVAHTLKYCPFNSEVPPNYRNANFEKARAAAAKMIGLEPAPVRDEMEDNSKSRARRVSSPEVSCTIKDGKKVFEITRASQTDFDFDELSQNSEPEFAEFSCCYKDAMIQTDDVDFDELSSTNGEKFVELMYDWKNVTVQTDDIEEDGFIMVF